MLHLAPYASSRTVADLRASADIIEEVSANVIYFGFCKNGDYGTDDERQAAPIWSIMKVEISGDAFPITTKYLWAGGLCSYSQVWNQRADLEYKYKKF